MSEIVSLVCGLLVRRSIPALAVQQRIEAIRANHPSVSVTRIPDASNCVHLTRGESIKFCVDAQTKSITGTFAVTPGRPPKQASLSYIHRGNEHGRTIRVVHLAQSVASVLTESTDRLGLSEAQQEFCDLCDCSIDILTNAIVKFYSSGPEAIRTDEETRQLRPFWRNTDSTVVLSSSDAAHHRVEAKLYPASREAIITVRDLLDDPGMDSLFDDVLVFKESRIIARLLLASEAGRDDLVVDALKDLSYLRWY